MKNPLLIPFNTPHHTPPFNEIRIKDFKPAIETAIQETRSEVETIILNPQHPDFKNTVGALARSGKKLDDIVAIFFNLNAADTQPEMQKIAKEISPLLSELNNSIYMNQALFQRTTAVYEAKDTLQLNTEETTLLEITRKAFIKGGANLKGEAAERFKVITAKLSELSL